MRVYNLEVEEYHTYFAGDFWVHNEKGGPDTTRDDFPDTAYWEAHLETDEQGQASFEVDLPDNLTTWRILTTVASKDTAVGDVVKKDCGEQGRTYSAFVAKIFKQWRSATIGYGGA